MPLGDSPGQLEHRDHGAFGITEGRGQFDSGQVFLILLLYRKIVDGGPVMSAMIISAPPARSAFVDRELHAGNGYVMLGIGLALTAVSCWLAYTGFVVGQPTRNGGQG